jgi:hypothetical protein
MVTVYRGVSDEAIEHLKQKGYLPPSDPDHAIPNDPVLLEALFPEEWEHEKETGDSGPLDEALVEVFPWYDPEDVRRSLRWSANVTTDPGNAEGYGNLIELLVDENDVGLIDQYGMIRDVRAARMA